MKQASRKPTTVGDILQYEYLEPLDLKINDLAEILHVHRNTVSALVNNNRKLTTDMAFRLAKAFDTSVDFWRNLQAAVDLWEVENDMRAQEELNRIVSVKVKSTCTGRQALSKLSDNYTKDHRIAKGDVFMPKMWFFMVVLAWFE